MKKTWIFWLLSLLLFGAAAFVNTHIFEVGNILQIEFARTEKSLGDCLEKLSAVTPDAYRRLLFNTIVDYVFLISYTLVIVLSIRITLNALELKDNKWIYSLGILPGVMDAIENSYLIATALNQRPTISEFYVIVVRIKWAAAIPFYLLFLVVAAYGLVILFRANQSGKVSVSGS